MEDLAKLTDLGKPRVVIVGGGFAGLELAKQLRDVPVQVVLIDKQNYHNFQPLLYQVATAGLDASDIVSPFRKILGRQKNFYFRMAEVQSVDADAHVLQTSIGLINYDYLVIATGSTTNYFGDDQMEANAIAIKSIEDAIELRNTVLANFEKALQMGDAEQMNSLLDFVIVGGGPTGVEVAGALSELRKHVFPCDYKELDFKQMDIHLIQSGPVLLKGMSAEASQKSLEYLEEYGVKVVLNSRVKSYDGYTVTLSTGETLITRTLIWAAGVTGAPIPGLRPEALLKGNRYKVDEYSRVEGYTNVFALGDIASMQTPEFPEGHPMVAQPALQQGRLLGHNLPRLLNGHPLEPFRYDDKGAMATVGRNRAVADLKLPGGKDYRTQGLLAWLMWTFIHVISLVSFRNRFAVLLNWTWSYFSYDKGDRSIIGKAKDPLRVKIKPPVEQMVTEPLKD
ncbi:MULTISPECIES: NAD(P)/FAD-dependent oxidoreductase [Hymenobacter]|uniref:NADH:ubiquinone reductase (non-electrogenic) n=1 Tax=Hymenobacter profundi TaxID=1982110 RepID=A0ABS6X5L0_9BACT|nr:MULTISPECIES: NAD(P)/FAD-dependent oxidoreductase [Hymenobacter]MBW3131118.1 NAD(P)/FAD-dependent oxidoreductase [Hymenobacter profundi]QNE41403.1 NAD(P)/FAD-dependent oxidoreductase [Hymenobacter sp. NBH84]